MNQVYLTKKKWYCSIQWKIFIAMFCIMFVMILLGGIIEYYIEKKQIEKKLNTDYESVFMLIQIATSEAVLSEDIPLIETVLNGVIKNNPDIQSLQIANESDNNLYSWERKKDKIIDKQYLYQIRKGYEVVGEVFGSLAIIWDKKRIYLELKEHTTLTIIYSSFALIILTVMTLVVIRLLVILPFNKINMQLVKIAQGDLQSQLPLNVSSEFINIIESVNELSRVLRLKQLNKEELEKAHNELQVREKELCDAVVVASQANQAKSAFLATMSHEIRTPINAILGSIGLIKDFPLNNEQLKFLDLVDKSAKSLLNIINDILDFSKIEADKVEIENNPFLFLICSNTIRKCFKIAGSS